MPPSIPSSRRSRPPARRCAAYLRSPLLSFSPPHSTPTPQSPSFPAATIGRAPPRLFSSSPAASPPPEITGPVSGSEPGGRGGERRVRRLIGRSKPAAKGFCESGTHHLHYPFLPWFPSLPGPSPKSHKRLDDNKRACLGGEEATESLISGDLHSDSNERIWCEPIQEVATNFSRTVVSLALSNGDTILFACSGIAIESMGSVTSFITSASLVRALLYEKTKGPDVLKIEVFYGGNLYTGSLQEYDLDHDIALVNVMANLDVHGAFFYDAETLPHKKVVALGRDASGKLMATSGILTAGSSGSEDSQDIMLSTCKIPEAWEGGPLVDFDGNFVGMNLCLVMEGTFFLPAELILERLEYFRTSLRRCKFIAQFMKSKTVSRVEGRQIGDISNSDPEVHIVIEDDQIVDLDSLGYPKPSKIMSHDGMILVNTFEETFGDAYCKGVWNELSNTVSATIHRNVVALASFKGETRYFACTGFFIESDGFATILTSASLVRSSADENKIDEDLRIEVLLPNNNCRSGTLQHYNLHYNVALVSVQDHRAVRPAIFQREWYGCPSDLVAVGRCFKSGTLMASKGRLVDWTGKLNCKQLVYSTCQTTKAGIGGPLVDFNGKFIGMNFYGFVNGDMAQYQ